METLSNKSEIQKAFTEIRAVSFYEKNQSMIEEESINEFLDSILNFKKLLVDKTNTIFEINQRLERLTWFNNLDEECLMMMNDLISLAKDLRGTLVRQYIAINHLRSKAVAKQEIKDFKNSMDELKEAYEDLESVFFFLPKMPDFVETTKKLSLI